MRSATHVSRWRLVVAMVSMVGAMGFIAVQAPVNSGASSISPQAHGELDCNGASSIQSAIRPSMLCTDIKGISTVDNANTWGGRFYDNNLYIGHDEPDMTFLSNKPQSGSDVTWTETLGSDPAAAPTVATPGKDVAHWNELSVAPWFSMALCDSNSYPAQPCTPHSDANAPAPCSLSVSNFCPAGFSGGGSAFMEMQFYPPGMAPFAASTSCDNTHWCAALNIDSLMCTAGYASCNPNCIEPVNFAFIQRNGVPAGPPSPQLSDLSTYTPNAKTLLMNPGDRITVHMGNFPTPGGGSAFTVYINDWSTGQSGFMQASAANGFATTSQADCSGTPYNFQPEYNTAARGNIVPWAALQTNISTQFEIGHFTACTSLSDPFTVGLSATVTDTSWGTCNGPYETSAPGGDGGTAPEASDALCYPAGDTHGVLHSAPNVVTGCLNDYAQNGDLDFDGSSYWPEWPTSANATSKYPASFVQSQPQSTFGQYSHYFIQTDTALSETTCDVSSNTGCAVPPPNAPGQFYPYWSLVGHGDSCVIEFGNVSSGPGVNNLGGVAQYGTSQAANIGYPELEGPVQANNCAENRH